MEGDEERRRGLLLALRIMILVVTPSAVGLAAVAPTLSKLAFDPRYQEGIIKVLQVLAMFAMARTITWVCNSYLQVRNQARTIMFLETARLVGIVVFMNLFILAGWHLQGKGHAVRWACASVVFVFMMSGLSYMAVIRRLDGVSLRDQILPILPPLVACVPMVLAVVGARRLVTRVGLFALDHPTVGMLDRVRVFAPRLALEILVGTIVFVPSALLFARGSSRALIGVVRDALQRRRAPAPAQP
jgi:PST family polysaccharide transporter